jgi:ribonuclease BN (tRNA processing enzyme)
MDYKIIFLGTAGSSATYQQLRSAGGIILKFDNKQFHIDPGPGSLPSAREASINLKETDVIIATHNHLNHYNDVNVIINAMTYQGMDKSGSLIISKSLEETKFLKDYLDEFFSLEPNQTKDFEEITVRTLPTKHEDETAIGLKFSTPDLTITYTSDTGYSKELLSHYKNSDILILNNVYPAHTKKDSNNLHTEDTIKIIKAVKPSLAIIQHYGTKMYDANPLYEAREIQKKTDIQTIAAKDGLMINPLSKSISLRQKSLNQY